MDNIKKHLEQAEKNLNSEWQEKEKSVIADIEQTINEISELAKTEKFSPFSILNLENQSLDGVSESQNLPELVRIGKLNPDHYSDKLSDIPMLLPFTEKAVSFLLDENNVHTLFSLIAFRFMLSLPLNLTKFYFVDNNLGSDFALVNKINRENIEYTIIANQQDRNKLFCDLEQLVSDFNKKHKASFNSLKDYNKTAGALQEAYHFVFITNFPAGFTAETAEKLNTLISNGNAAKAGIYLFFSIDRNEKPPFGVDIDQFSAHTTCIHQISNIYQKESKINDIIYW